MSNYFSDILHKPTSALEVPDLQIVAKNHDVAATLLMCRLAIAIGVQCEKNKDFIEKIQALTETDQHFLMKAIEQVNPLSHVHGNGLIKCLRSCLVFLNLKMVARQQRR